VTNLIVIDEINVVLFSADRKCSYFS